MIDVAIVGCGVVGASIAYALSQYQVRVAVVEQENDVCCHTSKANSAIIHGGYDPEPGSLMARLNVRGNALVRELCAALDIPFRANGSLVVAFSEDEKPQLEALLARGQQNGVPQLSLISGDEARGLEPHLSKDVLWALHIPTGGIVDTWELTIAQAEVAVQNGMELHLETSVSGITAREDHYLLHTNHGDLAARYVINAAGLYADRIHNMIAPSQFEILPVKGEYLLLDKEQHSLANHTIFQCPTPKGKGVLVAPTVHGNLLTGPTSVAVQDREDLDSTRMGMDQVKTLALKSIPEINFGQVIRTFSGLRATASTGHDFHIAPADGHPRFIDVAGIQSPGLTSAPAIAEYLLPMLREAGLPLRPKDRPVTTRNVRRFKKLSTDAKNELIAEDPAFGRIVCRCETITEGEILDCLRRPIVPRSMDAIKRRCTAGLGRCQGGFCGPRVLSLLARARDISPLCVLQDLEGSLVLMGETKEGAHGI